MQDRKKFYNNQITKMQQLAKNPYYGERFAFLNKSQIRINQKMRNNSPYLNKVHLTPFAGLMNDPNGLVYKDGYYYIFYQNVPQIAMHKTKLWSAYRTKDFQNFENLEVQIVPSIPNDWDGVFSGGALNYQNQIYAYYTGNTKTWLNEQEFERGSATIVTKFDDQKHHFEDKKVLFEVDKTIYTGDFRDPFPFIKNNQFYLFHGAQLKNTKKGVISIYESNFPDRDFKFKGTLEIQNFQTPDAYMYECPIFFELNGYDVLSFSTQGQKFFKNQNEKNDNVVLLLGKMDWENLIFEVEKVSHADLGFDFYAPQIFHNTPNDEIIYLGWAAKPQDLEAATFDDGYAHHMNFPRLLTIKEGILFQRPYQIQKLQNDDKQKISHLQKLENKAYFLDLKTKEQNFEIKISNDLGDQIKIDYQNQIFKVDRSLMSIWQSPETGLAFERNISKIDSLEIILDTSFIEIFINQGQEVFSSKFFITNNKKLELQNIEGTIMSLKEFQIENPNPKTIILPGEALIDKYQINGKVLEKVGGAPLNVCGAIGLLNSRAYFLGTIGNDAYGKQIQEFFVNNHLNSDFLSITKKPTTIANVILDQTGERNFTFQRGADQELELKNDLKFDALVLSSATAFLGGKLLDTYYKLAHQAQKEQKLIFFDPNYRDALYGENLAHFRNLALEFIDFANVIKLSDEELELIFNLKLEEIQQLNLKYQDKIFLITLGAEGTLVYFKGQTKIIPSITAKVEDTTGAGDSFFGYFIAQFVEHDFDFSNLKIKDFAHIVLKANICASFVISKPGAIESLPTVQEIEKKFNEKLIQES
ncbi:PfkB family carbohydrate kinase [Mycoplasmopsis gallopavonis]|uniref:beta-fructofuranosidase n=1 Tax=Mycoplasmopsis gallopavonis TaxID=76629 RepID=A0A449B0N2_9BACT|nr:PfkB family carbohydrate kinase [Mycoplasmopsis gallopavonis]RIV16999.1 hypothetical protein D1113_00035 [Mycoplasmopsis gallopavonis]VEU73296.1 Sucrose-6-phosphate hydrolase [Mycoplasmopsis gallopavonis]